MRYVGRRARYGVPAVAVLAVGAAAWVPTLSGASAPPGLPSLSVTQLLADVAKAQPPQVSGSLTWTANLGLSDLSTLESGAGQSAAGSESSATSGFDPLTMLSGSHEIDVWLDGAQSEHLALLLPPAEEVDLVRNGDQAWLWDSSTNTATHLVGPQTTGAAPTSPPAPAAGPAVTPQQLASRLLGHLSASTSVTMGDPLYVAGQPAYQLIVAPKSASGSTVDHIEVDVGASGPLSGVPLQVAVYATGQTAAALELGFTGALHLGTPPAAELTFTPPPGARVVTHTLTAGGASGEAPKPGQLGSLHKTGTGWTTVISGSSSELVDQAQQGALSEGTTVVDFDGLQGRLFSTDLLNVLILPGGQFYAGLVTPGVLEAAASASS
ncbi:MAG: hypothetical protein ABSE77_01025 [Acidimicrobiales bacterium]|jgi:hypothetical protein